jgi:hypothetical protein
MMNDLDAKVEVEKIRELEVCRVVETGPGQSSGLRRRMKPTAIKPKPMRARVEDSGTPTNSNDHVGNLFDVPDVG